MEMQRLLLITAALFVLAGFCNDVEIVKVRGRGIGTTKMEALKDAYRDAVEQAVGLYVDAEQMVENEDLVKDQILTQSNAYIEKYKIAKEGKSENGLIAVTILANVRKRALTRKIRGTMPSNKIDLSGISKDIHAQIVTDFKRKADTMVILKNELGNLSPVKQLMKVSLGSIKPIVEPVPEDAGLVRLWYPIKVEVDRTKYYKDFVPRISRIIDQIKVGSVKRFDMTNNLKYVKAYEAFIEKKFGSSRTGRTGVMTRSAEHRRDEGRYCISYDALNEYGLALNQEYNGVCFLDSLIYGKRYIIHGLTNLDLDLDDDQFVSSVHKCVGLTLPFFIDDFGNPVYTMRGGETLPEDCKFHVGIVDRAKGQTLSGVLYKIPYECVKEITMWQEKTVGVWDLDKNREETLPKTMFALSFVDGTGNEVTGRSFTIRNMDVINFTSSLLEDTKGNNRTRTGGSWLWSITPLVGGFAKSYIKWVSVDIPKDDVAKIASASISVEE